MNGFPGVSTYFCLSAGNSDYRRGFFFFSFIHADVNHFSRSSPSTWHALSRASAGGAVPFGAVDCGSEEAAAEHLPLQPEWDSQSADASPVS